LEVARGISRNIFENQGSSWKFVDCGLILNKYKGLLQSGGDFWISDLFPNGKRRGLDSWLVDHGRRWSIVDRG
jgi:hypothetical protein